MTLRPSPTRLLPLASLLVLLAACGGGGSGGSGGEDGPSDLEVACAQVDCGSGGRCVLDGTQPACLCDVGHRAEGLRCTPLVTPAANPCEPNPCGDPLRRVCSVSAGAAVCSCPSGYAPLGQTTCEPERAFDCDATAPAGTGDAAEPDPCPTRGARTLLFDRAPEARTLAPEGDVDWMLLPTTQGRTYEVRAESPDALALTLEVRSADGLRTVASDRLGRATATVRFRADVAGHTLRVRTLGGSGTGAYQVGVRDLGVDDHGDGPAHATALPLGTTLQGALFAGDADLFTVALVADHTFEVQAVGTGDAAASLVVELLGESGVLLRRQTGSVGLLRPLVRVAGTYLLRVSSSTGQPLEYTLGVRDLGADDHGDLPSEGTPAGGLNAGTLERAGDMDVFTFPSAAGQVHRLTCTPQGFGCRLRVRGPTGALLRERAADYYLSGNELYVKALTAGLQSVEVSAVTTATGTYSLVYEQAGTDDHGDTPATATQVTPGTGPLRGALEAHGDVDAFAFGAQAGRVYRLRCTGTEGSYYSACRVRLRSAAGALLKASDAAQLGYEALADGVLVAEVVPTETWGRGTYALTLEDAGPDDHGDTVATATLVTPGTATPAAFEYYEDVDVLTFDVQPGRVYHFRCTPQGTTGCLARLRSASGTQLASGQAYSSSGSTLLLAYEATVAERLSVELSTYGYASDAPWGAYTYQLQDLGLDDHGDTVGQATALQPGDTGSGRIESEGDVDAFAFTVAAGRVYRFSCQQTPAGTYASCPVSLRDAQGTVLVQQRDDGVVSFEAGSEPVAVRALVTRGYYGALFDYTYRLEDLGADDHGDTHETATAHTAGTTPLQARLETATDVDVFAVPVVQGRIYSASASFGAYDPLSAHFYSAAGAGLGSEVEATESGTLYVRVAASSYSSGTTGTYTLRVLDLGVDDHADSATGATRLQLGVAATGALETSSDKDVFVVTLAAGASYVLSAPNTTVRASVRAPGGAAVLGDDYTSSGRTFQASVAGDYTVEVQRYWSDRDFSILVSAQ